MHMRAPIGAQRSAALLLACLLLLATGVAALGFASTIADPVEAPMPTADPADHAALAAVGRFYAAANAVLRTGNPALFDEAVAPDYVDHALPTGMGSDRAALAALLVARHLTFPDERLVVDRAVAGGDEVAVRIHVEGRATGAFLGLPLPDAAGAWGPLESFRIEGGAIVERWGQAAPVVARPLWQVPCPSACTATPRVEIVLDRIAVAPGENRVFGGDAAARLVVVETGSLVAGGETGNPDVGRSVLPPLLIGRGGVAVEGTRPALPSSPDAVEVTDGDAVLIGPMTRLAARNQGSAPAAVVTAAFAASGELPVGMETKDRAVTEVALSRDTTVAAGRLVLAPGGELTIPAAGTGTVLVVVETGELEVARTSGSGGVEMRRAVEAGAGTEAIPGDRWTSGTGEPVTLLVVAIAANSQAAGATPAS
jgi:predicted ester cyclase